MMENPRLTRRQVIVLIALGIFVALVIIAGLLAKQGILPGVTTPPRGENIVAPKGGATSTTPVGASTYSPTVPNDAKLSTPAISAPASPNSSQTWGVFTVTASRNGFDPSTITVKKLDLVQIRLTAADGDYDFSVPYLGVSYAATKKGETRQINFQANTSGTFVFECRDYCGGGKIIQGQLIVLP